MVGRTRRGNLAFELDGVTHMIPAGTVLASTDTDLYSRDGFTCLWLR